MNPEDRVDPPLAGGEKETLLAFLDYHRDTLMWKVDGVSDEDLRRPLTPTGLTLLGLVKHLAYVERAWFQDRFANREVPFPWTKEDPDADFRIEDNETTQEIIDLYERECQISRDICAEASLDDIAASTGSDSGGRSGFSLRWIVTHMIEETARHNGHADIMRETIDGSTGE